MPKLSLFRGWHPEPAELEHVALLELAESPSDTHREASVLTRIVTMAMALTLSLVLPVRSQGPGDVHHSETDASVRYEDDGERFHVERIILEYIAPHPAHPPIEAIMKIQVQFTLTSSGYVAARPGTDQVAVILDRIPKLDQRWFYASAIRNISEAIVKAFNDQGLTGVFVRPDPKQIDETGEDLRDEDERSLRFLISTNVVTRMRSIGTGDRFGEERAVNHAAHRRILDRSPVRPGIPDEPQKLDLLRIDLLDAYAFRLSRHPSRRVDVAVAAYEEDEESGVELQYLINESRPWRVFGQVSNTGTEQTDEWREHFGFVHHQFTGNDDVLSIDYMTAGF